MHLVMTVYNNIRGIKALGHLLSKILPVSCFRLVLRTYHCLLSVMEVPMSWYAFWRMRCAIAKIANSGKPIRFGFYVVLSSMFQWRRVFRLMLKDPRFAPFIVVTPRIGWHIGDMEATVEKTYSTLVSEFGEEYVFKGYCDGVFDNHIERCDACTMMNLYSGLAEKRFEVMHFAMRGVPVFGSCYFYDQGTVHSKEYYGMRSLKFVWKFFCANVSEMDKFVKYQKLRQPTNRVELSGSPKSDAIVWSNDTYRAIDRKVVLIAPHHSVIPTIDSGLCLGNFVQYYDYFLKLPNLYPEVDWIFRPHPHLRLNLIKNLGWTESQWDSYVGSFISHPNAVYEDDGPYYETFKKSDAILHDCGSFLPEYFYTGKPICYMLASEEAKRVQFDEWGQSLIDHTYQAYSQDDIARFVEDVVIKGQDPMKDERQRFAREKIMVNYPHASEYIVESIAEMLGRGKDCGKSEKK